MSGMLGCVDVLLARLAGWPGADRVAHSGRWALLSRGWMWCFRREAAGSRVTGRPGQGREGQAPGAAVRQAQGPWPMGCHLVGELGCSGRSQTEA